MDSRAPGGTEFRSAGEASRGAGVDIAVRDVVKDYGGGRGAGPGTGPGTGAALRGVSLDVERGELLALLGPSGSGKTTLLRVIAGLESHERGSVSFDGASTAAMGVGERGVGFVFQHYALFRHMTVFDNVAYGLRVRPRRRRPAAEEIRRRVLSLLDLVQLGGLEGRYPGQLSGGQRQRVALARALAIEPRVLLLDEPFGALDARVRRDLRRWLREIHERTGQTTVFVTHDQDEAMELADRVAILNAGLIEQVGTPAEIYSAPATAFVASFVGDPTALDVAVEAGRVRLGGPGGHDVGAAPDGMPAGAARQFLRPGDAALAPAGQGVPGRVEALLWAARGARAEVSVEGLARRIEVDLAGEGPGGDATGGGVRVGDAVGLRFDRLRVYPPA